MNEELDTQSESTDLTTGETPNQRLFGMCDLCMISKSCKSYSAGSPCSIDFNSVFLQHGRTAEGVKESALDLLELQYQRIQRSIMMEGSNYGVVDPAVGQELERYFKLLEKFKKLHEKPANKLTITEEGGGGILSKLLKDNEKSS